MGNSFASEENFAREFLIEKEEILVWRNGDDICGNGMVLIVTSHGQLYKAALHLDVIAIFAKTIARIFA
jgi:hypothetical protein